MACSSCFLPCSRSPAPAARRATAARRNPAIRAKASPKFTPRQLRGAIAQRILSTNSQGIKKAHERPGTQGKILRRANGSARGRIGGTAGKSEGQQAEEEKTMPVYLPPRVIRLWIAPWQDAHGVFHSEKYVYLLAGKGRWTLRGKTVPLGEPGEEYPGEIRLRGTERAP